MMDVNKFFIEVNNEKKVANILTNFSIYNDNYCIYTIPNDNEKQNVYCAKLVGNQLQKIVDEKELNITNKIVKEFISSLNKITN